MLADYRPFVKYLAMIQCRRESSRLQRRPKTTVIGNVHEALHRIRVKLYPSHLPRSEGGYIARTDSEASLSVEEVCAALKNRGGFTGSYDDLVEHVHQFLDEAAYQLCDGFAVNARYFSIYPVVGGLFTAPDGSHPAAEGVRGTEDHPVSFRFRARAPLRRLVKRIVIEVAGPADLRGCIAAFTDLSSGAVNGAATPGGLFNLTGRRIKVSGDDAGVYFISAGENPREAAAGPLAENTRGMLAGLIPESLTAGAWKVAVKTRYTGSANVHLKHPRVIESPFTLTVD